VQERQPCQSESSMCASTSRQGLRGLTSNQVLRARCDELAFEATQGSLPACKPSEQDLIRQLSSVVEDSRSVPLALLAVGIMPWSPGRYPRITVLLRCLLWLLVSASAAGFFSLSFRYVSAETCGSMCWQRNGFLSEVTLPIGAVLALATVSMSRRRNALEATLSMLRDVSLERKFEDWQTHAAYRDKAVYMFIWLCVVLRAPSQQRAAQRWL